MRSLLGVVAVSVVHRGRSVERVWVAGNGTFARTSGLCKNNIALDSYLVFGYGNSVCLGVIGIWHNRKFRSDSIDGTKCGSNDECTPV